MLEPTLTRAHYLDPAAFDREKERIFFREWVCVGRGEEVPNPGDYLLLDIVGESVLLVRDRDGTLAAHYNVCRHRGSQLVLGVESKPSAESSRTTCSGTFSSGIRCPYHAWTYNLDGTLRTAPYLEAGDALCKEDLPLFRVDVSEWGGFVFLNLGASGRSDDSGPRSTLAQQLGDAPERVKRYPLSQLRIAQRISYEVAANWKVVLENYNECYHCGTVHPELCRVVPAFKQKGGADLDWERGVPHKEGAWTFTMSGTTNRQPFAGLNEDEQVRHKGELIYPNFMLSLAAEHAAAFTLWPHGPDRTTVVCDFLFHPDEMARPDFHPADAVEFWDITNRQDWTICESVQRGMRSRVFTRGFYAPMEVLSLDIRKWLEERI